MTTQNVVGIDASLTATAVCSMPMDAGYSTMEVFSSKPANGLRERIERFTELANRITEAVKACNPEFVAIEGYSMGSKGSSVTDLCEFGGLLRLSLLGLDGVRTVEVSPNTLKTFATGKGNANKMQVAVAIAKRYDVEFNTDDEYDSYGLARIALVLAGFAECANEDQRRAIAGMEPKPKKAKKVKE